MCEKTVKNEVSKTHGEHYKGVEQRDPGSPVGLGGDVRDVSVAQGRHLENNRIAKLSGSQIKS